MPIPLDARKKPKDIKVHVSTGEGVDIAWEDGHVSHYDFPYLRDHCPCALCNDEREKRAADKSKPGNAFVIPMFKPRVKADRASAVGNYAIQIDFSDGHATGIFSFGSLREMCPCEACQREIEAASQEAGDTPALQQDEKAR